MTDTTTEPDLAKAIAEAPPGSPLDLLGRIIEVDKLVSRLLNVVTEIHQRQAETAQQLQNLLVQTAVACATCLAEECQQTRPGHNIANAIVDGTGYCNEHLDVLNGRLVPKKSSGLIVTGG